MELKLYYTGDASGLNAAESRTIETFVSKCPYTVIATDGGSGARLSALGNLPEQTLAAFYFGTSLSSVKAANLRTNPHCEIMFTDGDSQVMLGGTVEIHTDRETRESKWQPWMQEHFTNGTADSDLCFLKFTPRSVRAMLA